MDQAIIPRALATGNLTLLTETRVLYLNLDSAGEISSINCVDAHGPKQLSAKGYVLAGGAVETPRLMLSSTNAARTSGLSNSNDQVGRYFMEAIYSNATFTLDSNIKTYTGPPLDSRAWDFCKPKDKQTNGFVLGVAGYLHLGIGPANNALNTHGIGRAHLKKVQEKFGREIYVFGIAEQEPVANNRLTLSTEKDKRGQAKIKVHCEYSERDKVTVKIINKKLRDWVSHAPTIGGVSSISNTLFRSAATHVGGTCRMGNHAGTSVVDSYGKVHGQNNCYIADASVLPTQGSGDSPSLTIQALALRTADRIVADLNETN